MADELPNAKRGVLEKLLSESMVLITLDARHAGVDVPVQLRDDAQLRLNLSWRFGLPMEFDDWGVHATLTFRGVPYACHVPWEPIYMVVSHATGQPFLFPNDVPPELASDFERAAASGQERGKPELRVIEPKERGGANATPTPDAAAMDLEAHGEPASPPKDDAPRRGHLRLVK